MTSKNKVNTQIHIQCQQAKKQAIKQTNNCARRMSQHAEKCRNMIVKNHITYSVIATSIKAVLTPDKDTSQTKSMYQKEKQTSAQIMRKKTHNLHV